MTCLKIFSSFFMRSRRSRHTFLPFFLLFVGEVFWNQMGTNFPHAQFLGQNVVDGLVIQIQPIILTLKRRSDLTTRAFPLVTFSSVFDVRGLTERGSSSTLSRPCKNDLCHLQTCVLVRASLHKPVLTFLMFLLRFP